jgi:opacity protein-like surface antigen
MKTSAATGLLLVLFSAAAWGVYPFPDVYKQYEIGLFGGFGLPRVRASSSYADVWNYLSLTRVSERTSIGLRSSGGALSLGASIGYFFGPKFGLQAGVFRSGSDLETASDFDFQWTWSPSVGNGSFQRSAGWDGTGRLRTTVASLNLVRRFVGEKFEGFVAAGPAVFFNSATAETGFGFGFTKVDSGLVQHIDALGVGLEWRDKTWTKVGAGLGAGIAFKLNETLGVSLEGRYFICPAQTLDWDFVLGSYNGLFFSSSNPLMRNIPFDKSDVTFVNEGAKLANPRLTPSFFQLLAGLKVFFGD